LCHLWGVILSLWCVLRFAGIAGVGSATEKGRRAKGNEERNSINRKRDREGDLLLRALLAVLT
jgi:hypothetical protein